MLKNTCRLLYRHFQLVVCLTVVSSMVLVQGCTHTGTGRSSQKNELQNLFKPASFSGARKITDKEAARLVQNLSPRNQGMSSWTEYAFALEQSINYVKKKKPSDKAFNQPGLTLTFEQMEATLCHLKALLPKLDSNPKLLATNFTWYRIGPDFGITGYYEPTLYASRLKTDTYQHPLYCMPKDVRPGVPYHTRNAIDRNGALKGKKLEIAWVNSDVDVFFLHIQGSGRLRFPDGSVTHVLYAGKNNRSYKALGRVMCDEGLLEDGNISMNSIREVLERYPERKAELFDKNPSYVFFREADKGPIGAMGRTLTPWVSLATDRKTLPHGLLNFLITPVPDATGSMLHAFHGLTLPQDTGGAIKGSRIDLFCGPGQEAEHTAGYLDATGAVYVLVKK